MSRSNKRKQVDRTAQHESEGYNEEDMDSDDWKSVKEPHKRRQIQNRLAQRRYREKVKNEKDDSAQQWRDRAAAGNAYSQPNTRELERNNGTSGVPWGGLSMRHVVERGWARDQEVTQQRSLEASAYFTQASTPGLQTKAGYYGTQYGGVQDPSSYLQDQHFQARAEPMMQGAHIRAPREEGGLSTGSYTLRSSMAASLRNMP